MNANGTALNPLTMVKKRIRRKKDRINEWSSATWGATLGCTKVSQGCKNCYAEALANRFHGGFQFRLAPHKLTEPLHRGKAERYFVSSASDLFHEEAPDGYIEDVCRVMQAASWHIFVVLTKRSQRMRDLLNTQMQWAAQLRNVWWGVTAEDRKSGLPRLQDLRETQASMRWVSLEPLLEDMGQLDLSYLSWVVCGGESGPDSRDMQENWVRSIRDQCMEARVPFLFKQFGGVRRRKRGCELDGKRHENYPPEIRTSTPSESIRQELWREFEAEFDQNTAW